MDRILILVKNKRDRGLLEEWLRKDHEILPPTTDEPLEQSFDLAIIDGPTLRMMAGEVRARREAEEPVLVPFLLLTYRRMGCKPTRQLGRLADDLLVRPIAQRELLARVANLLRLRRLSLELKKEHDRVVKLSVTDDVSGFHNTRYLHRYLDRVLSSPTGAERLSLVFFDLDNFKKVVDTHGHLLGSKVLKEVAQAVNRELAPDDRLVRYGGDEFVIILPRQAKEQALEKVRRIRNTVLTTPFLHKENLDVHVTASFGVATFPNDAVSKKELLASADQYLFDSKQAGKNRISSGASPNGEHRMAPAEDESTLMLAS